MKRLNTVYGKFRVNTEPAGHLRHLKIDFMKPTESSFVLRPGCGRGWTEPPFTALGDLCGKSTDFSDNLVFQFR